MTYLDNLINTPGNTTGIYDMYCLLVIEFIRQEDILVTLQDFSD